MTAASRTDAKGPRVRSLVTPEGVPLRFTLASPPDRAAAFLLDCVVMGLAGSVALLLGLLLVGGGALATILALLLLFFLRNFYFIWFESRWQGRTPGKRWLGLRVIDAGGGVLTSEAVVTRNFMRELELFLPAGLVLAPQVFWPGAPGWVALLAALWGLVLVLLPFFNRDHVRFGDLAGGTLVVRAPAGMLLSDLSLASSRAGGAERPTYAFTRDQLEVYGIYELQVLEDVLRKRGPGRREAMETVCAKIRERIGWEQGDQPVDPAAFLRAFYAAQRAHLEARMLLGERRERKRSRARTWTRRR